MRNEHQIVLEAYQLCGLSGWEAYWQVWEPIAAYGGSALDDIQALVGPALVNKLWLDFG